MSGMAFRKIRPSFGDSSTSTNNQLSTPESTGSDPRRGRGEKDVDNPKRRKVPESITRNACLNCKKARAKCDGRTPCKRCATRAEDTDCIYEIHIKHAKEELVKQIKQLKAKDHLSQQILQALSADEKVPEILDRLKNGETYESIVEWLGRSPLEEFETLSPRDSQHSAFEASDHEMGDVNAEAFRWTSVTTNKAVLDHLFQLYFAWVHPVHTLFHEGQFVNSYHNLDRYCTPVLVNALCAMACHLHSAVEGDMVNFAQLGEEFIDAVRASIDPEDTSLTTIQSFAVMFLVESARGNGLRASAYLKVATGSIPRVAYHEREGNWEVWKHTIRGIRNLNVEWAQVTFQIPPKIDTEPFDGIDSNDDKLDEANWHFYRYVNDRVPAWPSFQATTNREKSKLVSIVQDVTTAMYSQQGRQLSAQHVLQLYGRFVTWRDDLPSSIGNIERNKSQALPHVLSLLILYSNSVIQLLRPLLNFEGFPSHLIEDIIWKHAQQGLALLDKHYRVQFTCRCQPVLQMYAVLHLTDVVARFFPGGVEGRCKDGPEAIKLGMEVLQESSLGFPVAGPMLEMLRRTANVCSIRIPVKADQLEGAFPLPKRVYQMDDFIDVCTRPTYVQPVDEIRQRYLPSISVDWIAHGGAFGFLEPTPGARESRIPSAEEIGAQSLMQIRNLLNSN